jgi:hypothetical protein
VRGADRLRFRRSALTKIDGEDGHRPDGEELGLPVLQGVLPEIGTRDVAGPGHGGLVVEAKKIAVITMRSELEKTLVRNPPTFAHAGEFRWACGPISCLWSDSSPMSSGFFDSFEPRWTSQTVAMMKTVNWRNSDCQFSITA